MLYSIILLVIGIYLGQDFTDLPKVKFVSNALLKVLKEQIKQKLD